MKIMNRIHEKANDNANKPGVTIAFLGDSVTQGCFELYKKATEVLKRFLITPMHITRT